MGLVNAFLVYEMSKRLLLPFTSWPAFATGVIDGYGNIDVPKEKRTPAQNESFQLFDVMILNIKKLLDKIPGGQSLAGRVLSVAYLVNENITDPEQITMEGLMEYLKEDEATNSAGGGAVAGIGVGSQGEPGVDMKKRRKDIINKARQQLSDIDPKKYRNVIGKVNIGA